VLEKLTIRGFKSLGCVEDIELPPLAVLFGPNAAGKSNLIDAIQLLSRLATSRTLSEALSEPIRGYPIEAFYFPPGGLPQLLKEPKASFELEATIKTARERFRYRIQVQINPLSGNLSVADEYLASLTRSGSPKGNPVIEQVAGQLRIRRRSKPAHPRQEPIGLNHTILSDPRLGGKEYHAIEKCREEMSGWRAYYLDPRVAMREPRPPAAVQDIGPLGEHISSFLYYLRGEDPKRFEAVLRTLRTIVPAVDTLSVVLDEQRGTLDIRVRQDGTDFSSRIVSEGTLRVLALSALAANPWSGSLLAFEEPENGVHPRRLELIADLLFSLCVEQNRQVIVTTHSPLLCNIMARRWHDHPNVVRLFQVRHDSQGTIVEPFDSAGRLFDDPEITRALASHAEDTAFEGLVLRGLLDE